MVRRSCLAALQFGSHPLRTTALSGSAPAKLSACSPQRQRRRSNECPLTKELLELLGRLRVAITGQHANKLLDLALAGRKVKNEKRFAEVSRKIIRLPMKSLNSAQVVASKPCKSPKRTQPRAGSFSSLRVPTLATLRGA
eukprot:3194429-Pyramimonas_sp.AAC.1